MSHTHTGRPYDVLLSSIYQCNALLKKKEIPTVPHGFICPFFLSLFIFSLLGSFSLLGELPRPFLGGFRRSTGVPPHPKRPPSVLLPVRTILRPFGIKVVLPRRSLASWSV